MRLSRLVVSAFVFAAACGTARPGGLHGPTMNNRVEHGEELKSVPSVVASQDILDREPVTNAAECKHILIGWKDLAEAYSGHQDQRGAGRSKEEAEALVRTIRAQLTGGTAFDAMMKQYSEDEGSARTGQTYHVAPDAALVIEFRQLGLRLDVGEIGVVQSDFGFHIMLRVR